ncbi:MAG: ABC transporter ATP-binding protein [Bulleidia sp.]
MKGIRCENLHKIYGKGDGATHAVRGVNAVFEPGTFYSIIGKSGSGKSTLLYLLSGLLNMDEGEIFYDDVPLSTMKEEEKLQLKRRISLVFQNYQLLPELTVRENILLPCFLHDEQIDQTWCDVILDRLQIREIENKYPDQLSGGQQQRTAIGRAFMTKPEYLFCDEPTGNLDRKTSESVLHLLLEVRDLCNPLIILATHDLDIARSADIVMHIEDGQFIQD